MDEGSILDPNWLVAVGTRVLAIGAVFQDKIRAWLMRPKLDVSMRVASPDCNKTLLRRSDFEDPHSIECYYFRLGVTNTGNQKAEQVEVFAEELLKQQADGTFKPMESFFQ